MSTALLILAGALGLAVVAVVVLVVSMRLFAARREQRLRTFITTYAEQRGGSATFDDRGGVTVEGPLGSGHKSLAALRIMLADRPESEWETSVGFVFRAYLPDAFQQAFAKAASERLAARGPEVAALSVEELRQRLRVKIGGASTDDAGLITCARPLSERYEARVVVDGVDLAGLPEADRVRLGGSDDDVFQAALDNTLGEGPTDAACEEQAWLCRPADLFGTEPTLAVGVGHGLVWIPARQEALTELADLCERSVVTGPMKAVMWAWDGEDQLEQSTILVHTIIGPDSADYTVDLPYFATAALGVHAPDGRVDVKR